ncbi:MAG: hypothetical protein J6A01_10030, partial [Proteobacteria bacterium]|nr:hypothetical protein [Pseudomonadota bacterium]
GKNPENNYSLNGNHYELISPASNNPMSVRFHRFDFNFDTDSNLLSKITGSTLIGLTCGKAGCDRLVLTSSPITIKAPAGMTQDSTLPSNANWNGARNGMDGKYFVMDTGGEDSYEQNWRYNDCMRKYYSNSAWHIYSDYNNYSAYKCPDQESPRGGCASYYCCSGGCSYGVSFGRLGKPGLHSVNGGDGATLKTDVDTDSGCGKNNKVDINKPRGKTGKNGKGGVGGKNSNLYIEAFVNSNADLYMATYSKIFNASGEMTGSTRDSLEAANGKYGISGGGGGGGVVYQCFDNERYNNLKEYWAHAGCGGSGGCGGYGGKAGGTGGSAIGLVLTPPKAKVTVVIDDDTVEERDMDGYFYIDSAVNVDGKMGGIGTNGQNGQKGGYGGVSVGWATENTIGDDTHCIKGTAGGAGGSGGGGGGGAGGLAGYAYGYVFICNRSVEGSFDSTDHLENCGFAPKDDLVSSIGKVTAKSEKDYIDGEDGTAGAWNDEMNDGMAELNAENADAKKESDAGSGGLAGMSLRSGDNNNALPKFFIKTSKF